MTAIGFRRERRNAAISGTEQSRKSGTMRHPMHWEATHDPEKWEPVSEEDHAQTKTGSARAAAYRKCKWR
jgi:hypothetical protein